MLATERCIVRTSVDTTHPSSDEHPQISGVVERLNQLKKKVPQYMQQHGRRAWESAISATAPSKPIFTKQPDRIASRAFFKLREIALSCSLPRPSSSLHLGEAPGGFVQATEQFAKEGWRWSAVSLDVDKAPRPMLECLPTGCGEFMKDLPEGGNLLRDECGSEVVARIQGTVDLVTADGAIEMNHDRLEEEHTELLFAQTDVALTTLSQGGSYVCKFFEGARFDTRLWIALLTERFEFVSVIKPVWSRATNSERYIVCKHFQGDATKLPRCGRLSQPWQKEVSRILDRLCEDQSVALEKAIGS